MKKPRLGVDERIRIADALKSGKSQNAVMREFGRGASTVNNIAKDLEIVYSSPQTAIEARRSYARKDRILYFERVLTKCDAMLQTCEKPSQLREITISSAIASDKLRLEEDRPTDILETRGMGGGARARLQSILAKATTDEAEG